MTAESVAQIPADRRALVAIDLGAESCRISLLRWSGGSSEQTLVHRFATQTITTQNELRWNLEEILSGILRGLTLCAEIAGEGIRSIGVDGWAVDYVRINGAGEALGNPFCYRDERTTAAQAALHERIAPDRMRDLTGIELQPLNTAYQMFADPAQVRVLPWLNLPEYVLYKLGGRPVSERTNASHTQMLGTDGVWCEDILDALGLPLAAMPELVEPGTDIGQLKGELASLPAFAETRLIAPACHDTASAIAAIPDAGDDWAYISSGTWSLVGTLLQEPNNTPAARNQNFTNLRGADGKICFHKNVNGMWLLRQCLEFWKSEGATLDIPSLIAEASTMVGSPDLLHVDDPELLRSGQMPQRINTQLRRRNLPVRSVHAKNAAMMASLIFHSLAARYAEVLQGIAGITGKRFQRIYIMGGGSRNEFLNGLTAQATGLPVIPAGVECSTTGNYAVQLATLERSGNRVRSWAARLAARSSDNRF